MSDILLSVHVKAPLADVQAALSHVDGYSAWWTPTTGSVGPGQEVVFAFGEHHVHATIDEVTDQRVSWTFTAASPEWVGTTVAFDLTTVGEKTLIAFGHRGWAEAGGFYAHCSMKWATFLLSLKALTEQGTGHPFPNDTAI